MKKLLLLLLTLALLCPLFSACAKSTDVKTLYVYNWGEYISDGYDGTLDVNAAFEAWYYETYGERVKVNYSTYSSNEDMYNKLSSGATKYDVVVPSDYMIERMIGEDMLAKLDFDAIPNAKYIDYTALFGDEGALGNYYDKENAYSIPYTYGTVGIIYNQAMVDEADVGTWDLMWNEKYAGNILQFNNSRDAFATALYKLGYSVNTENEAEWREALAALKEQKPVLQGYVMDEVFNKMKSNSAAVAPYYAGDFFSMYEENESLGFFYPTDGKSNMFVDAMCIPKSSQNKDLASAYINFMLNEEIAVANAEYICYASPHKLVKSNEGYIEAMTDLHPDAMEILYGNDPDNFEAYENLEEDQLVLLNSLWEDLKIESSVGGAIIVTAAVIVASLVGVGIFLYVRRKKRRQIVKDLWA